jgi:cell wall-associated NlpC family hydrolase
MAGIGAPRDTDLQEKSLGRALEEGEPSQRGDLVFWKGHVGIMQDAERLLHANAFHLQVASEAFAPARARIAESGSAVTSVRRLEN